MSQVCLLKRSRSNDILVQPRSQILGFKYWPLLKNQGSLEKWLVPVLEQEKYKTDQEQLIMPKSNEVLKIIIKKSLSKGCRKELKGVPIGPGENLSIKINKSPSL